MMEDKERWLRVKLKKWENGFLEAHGRAPQLSDMDFRTREKFNQLGEIKRRRTMEKRKMDVLLTTPSKKRRQTDQDDVVAESPMRAPGDQEVVPPSPLLARKSIPAVEQYSVPSFTGIDRDSRKTVPKKKRLRNVDIGVKRTLPPAPVSKGWVVRSGVQRGRRSSLLHGGGTGDNVTGGNWQTALCTSVKTPSPLVLKPKNKLSIPGGVAKRLFDSNVQSPKVPEQGNEQVEFAKETKEIKAPGTIKEQKTTDTAADRSQTKRKTVQVGAKAKVPPKKPRVVSTNFVRLDLKERYRDRHRGTGRTAKGERRLLYQLEKEKNAPVKKNNVVVFDALDYLIDGDKTNNVAPICPGHRAPCAFHVVKKKNRNHGRGFFSCSFGRSGCNYFVWADDLKSSVLTEYHSKPVEKVDPFIDLRLKWEKKSVMQLKKQLKGTKTGAKKKGELLDALVEEGRQEVELAEGLVNRYREQGVSDDLLEEILESVFGFSSFRGDQLWAIKRVLGGESTLLVQATGSGKSLCYQLPALLLEGLTIVISPLVSLMEDQLASLPPSIPGACLSGQQSGVEIAKTIRGLRENRIKVLFLSPERLFSSSFQRLLSDGDFLPRVSCVCVDEAHCISSWSHNFRPTYLRLRQLLIDTLNAKCILGLTATATKYVVDDICDVLNIQEVRIGEWFRDNLDMRAIACEEEKMEGRFRKLVDVFKDPILTRQKSSSVIVYVRTKMETTIVAERLSAKGIPAKAYHGGMAAADRSTVQNGFMKGTFRVIVATVAFGMGIDKADVRGVIHFGLPRTIEDYVQEMGRAGRDGEPSLCVTLFHPEDEVRRHHSLCFSDGISRGSMESLLKHIECEGAGEVAINTTELSLKLDVKASVIETLLVYLSLPPYQLIRMKPAGFKCGTLTVLNDALCRTDLLCQQALAMMKEGGVFNLVKLARKQNITVSNVIRSLYTLRDQGALTFNLEQPSLYIDYSGVPFTEFDVDKFLEEKVDQLETHQTNKVKELYVMIMKLSKGGSIEQHISDYFTGLAASDTTPELALPFQEMDKSLVYSDVKTLLHDKQKPSSGRAIARILHGIPSPQYSYQDWRKNPLWGKRVEYSFREICNLANKALKIC